MLEKPLAPPSLIAPDQLGLNYADPLVGQIMQLEALRSGDAWQGNTPWHVFLQLKHIFHIMESLGSSRIEGNRTTIADYIETQIGAAPPPAPDEKFTEIENISTALKYIEEVLTPAQPLTTTLLLELHQLLMQGLTPPQQRRGSGEGDVAPGQWRQQQVKITGATHTPPLGIHVAGLMQDWVDYINRPVARQFDLLKVALAHHAFTWIHPFNNGNGRMARLLTYAMLLQAGFGVNRLGRLLNPTAIFCHDRQHYYDQLSVADQQGPAGLRQWCGYMIGGMATEISKARQLTQWSYTWDSLLLPAIRYCQTRGVFAAATAEQLIALAQTTAKQELAFKSDHVLKIGGPRSPQVRAQLLARWRQQQLIVPLKPEGRIYTLNFARGPLTRGLVEMLTREGFMRGLTEN